DTLMEMPAPLSLPAVDREGQALPVEMTLYTLAGMDGGARVLMVARAQGSRAEEGQPGGVLLAARTLVHEMRNRLALTAGYAELMADDPDLPDHLKGIANKAYQGVWDATG